MIVDDIQSNQTQSDSYVAGVVHARRASHVCGWKVFLSESQLDRQRFKAAFYKATK